MLPPIRYAITFAAMVARFTKRVAAVLAKRMKGDLSEVCHSDERTLIMKAKSAGLWSLSKTDQPQTLDSDLMAVGRCVLSADIWAELERTELVPGAASSSPMPLQNWRKTVG